MASGTFAFYVLALLAAWRFRLRLDDPLCGTSLSHRPELVGHPEECPGTRRRCAWFDRNDPRTPEETSRMTQTVDALVTAGASKPFERGTIERRDPRPHDVVIDIAYAGICHSDIHQAREEWGSALFPMVPGHEIAGVVREVGTEVSKYQVGDRVGVGCFVDSCRECANCKAGEEQYCLAGEVATYNGTGYDGEPTFGGYSKSVVVDENYVLGIPEGIGLDEAAPLLCAGITLYSPAQALGRRPGPARSPSSAWAASATWASRSPTPSAPR